MGLPFGIDIGAMSLARCRTPTSSSGAAELRWAISSSGSTTLPAIARARQLHRDQRHRPVEGRDGRRRPVDLQGHRDVHALRRHRPRCGSRARRKDVAVAAGGETSTQTKYFVGLNMNFAFINVAFEGDKTGDTRSFSAKLGWRF
ncbi:MAG: hypothetical protein MZV65_34710 [Chromatiales bacterium]|nr:hypothetical protein [Chromatiales bacterium]